MSTDAKFGSAPAVGTNGQCRANGIDIHFLRTGGDRPPLIALHGLIASGACLSPLARTLMQDFDVILPDARGHGASSAPLAGYSYRALAADVSGLIEKLELAAPILLGHSMGGLTAAVIAGRQTAPLSALVLIDPTFIGPALQREVFESDVAADHGHLLKLARPDLLNRVRQRSPRRCDELIGHMVDARFQTSPDAFEILTPPNPDHRTLVRNIRVPTLLVTGERGIVSWEAALELQQINPLVRTEMMADVGHGLPYDAPERLGEIILSFLSGAALERRI